MKFSFIAPVVTLLLLSAGVLAQEVPFSANDLAILFPIEKGGDHLPLQPVSVGDQNWRVISKTHFDSVLKQAKAQGVFIDQNLQDSKSWYLVGLRYAPCTLFNGKKPLCSEQIRFVFQPHGREGSAQGFLDYAMHVVFEFTQLPGPKRSAILEDFRSLKNQFPGVTLDKQLNVHPILNSAQGTGYFLALQKNIIEKHINSRQPSKITFIGLKAVDDPKPGMMELDADHWVFFSGDVITGQWALTNLPTGNGKVENLKVQGDDGEGGLVTDFKAGKNQINLFKKNTPDTPWTALDEHKTNDHNVSCASCHVADAYAFGIGKPQGARLNSFYQGVSSILKDKARLTEVLIEDSIHTGRIASELPLMRAFGYLQDRPLISQRLVNANALAVEQANKLLSLKEKVQCAGEQQRSQVILCLYLTDQASLSSCMEKYCD